MYILKLIALIQLLDAVSDSGFKIESCQVTILNTADELVRIEHKENGDWFKNIHK